MTDHVKPAVMTTEEAATYVGLSTSLLEKLRMRGTGPVFVKMSYRVVRYRQADLDNWMAAHVVASTSAPRPPYAPAHPPEHYEADFKRATEAHARFAAGLKK